MDNNIYVLGVDMEERSAEEIANQIVELLDRLVEEQEAVITHLESKVVSPLQYRNMSRTVWKIIQDNLN